jgi:hypothetical protein
VPAVEDSEGVHVRRRAGEQFGIGQLLKATHHIPIITLGGDL